MSPFAGDGAALPISAEQAMLAAYDQIRTLRSLVKSIKDKARSRIANAPLIALSLLQQQEEEDAAAREKVKEREEASRAACVPVTSATEASLNETSIESSTRKRSRQTSRSMEALDSRVLSASTVVDIDNDPSSLKVYIGDLPHDLQNEDVLYDTLCCYGSIDEVNVVRRKGNAFAFIHFSNFAECQLAIENGVPRMNGPPLPIRRPMGSERGARVRGDAGTSSSAIGRSGSLDTPLVGVLDAATSSDPNLSHSPSRKRQYISLDVGNESDMATVATPPVVVPEVGGPVSVLPRQMSMREPDSRPAFERQLTTYDDL